MEMFSQSIEVERKSVPSIKRDGNRKIAKRFKPFFFVPFRIEIRQSSMEEENAECIFMIIAYHFRTELCVVCVQKSYGI